MFGLFKSKSLPPIGDILSQAAQGQLTLIDVRDINEVKASGKIVGAKHIPLMQLANIADRRFPDHDPDLTLDRPIAVYCASGGRSQMARQVLQKLGFTSVENIGGFSQVVSQGGQIERV
jgi:rhodanese-related sulfurtransferase